jgi:hypothetical protein
MEAYQKQPSDYSDEKWKEYRRIGYSFLLMELSEKLQDIILEVLHSDKWDWFTDCDGCTAVSEPHWPTIYFPPCIVHDYRCFLGKPLFKAAKEFHALNLAYNMDKWRANLRFAGVVLAIPVLRTIYFLVGTPQERKKKSAFKLRKTVLK